MTPGTFEMLGRQPVLGRTFTDTDAKHRRDDQPRVLAVAGSAPTRTSSARVLNIQTQPRTIVGVMPPDFVFPYRTMLGPSGFTRAFQVDAWLPLAVRARGLARDRVWPRSRAERVSWRLSDV